MTDRETGFGENAGFTRWLVLVTVAGLLFSGWSVRSLSPGDIGQLGAGFWVAAAILVVGELRPLFTPGMKDENGVALSTAFVFALLLHWGIAVAVLMQIVATVITDVVQRRAWWRTAFNAAQYSLSYGAAYGVLALSGYGASPDDPARLTGLALPSIAVAGFAYFVTNQVLVGQAIALHSRSRLWAVLREDLAFQGLTTAALVALSPLVVVVIERNVSLVPLLLLPLYAVHRTASMSLELEREALHDSLTGLPNRKLLLSEVATAMREADRAGEQVAFFLLDLDRFKDINDTLGHQVGDELLQHVAARLSSVVRPGDVVARLGGDEFAVLLPTVRDEQSAREVAERIRRALVEPFIIGEVVLDLDASIGITLYPNHAAEAELLMQRADVAMYLAKENRSGCEVYSAERDPHSTQRLGLFGQLRRALDEDELVLHYQPKVDLANGEVVGVEALVRWPHPEHGLMPPDTFVPLAEQTGLMRILTQRVMDGALRQSASWAAEGIDVRMSVNVSARDLHDARFVDEVRAALGRTGVAPDRLELEVTERVVMGEPARALETITGLAGLGVRLSLDDFGTGYSSLAHLKRLPVAEIKIDKSFVLGMDADDDDATIVRSTIELAHGLGLAALAEGVETVRAWERLVELGCDAAQGFFLSRPLPAGELTEWLREREAAATGNRTPRRRAARRRTAAAD